MTNLNTSGMPQGRGENSGGTPWTRKQLKPPEAKVSMRVAMGVGNLLDTTWDFISNAIPATVVQLHPFRTGYFHPGYGSYFPGPYPYKSCHNQCTSKQPLNDLCIKHQEWRQFTPQGTDSPLSKFSNIYYHCRSQCVWLRCPDLVPALLEVPDDVQEQLSPIHKSHLVSVFGLFLS